MRYNTLSRTNISDYTLDSCPSCGFGTLRLYKDGHYKCHNPSCDRVSEDFPYDISEETIIDE